MRRFWPDLAIVCALCITAYFIGSRYIPAFRATHGPVDLVEHDSGAAVALACGRGFVDTGYDLTPGLHRFLFNESDTFNCDELPRTLPGGSLNFTQRMYRYLMFVSALVWMATGRVSWSGLAPIYGIFYACTTAVAYGLFRAAMRVRVLAALASIALMLSAIHLGHLPYLRDYSKAPFILGLLLIMLRLAAGPLTGRRALVYAAAFGATLGIGIGFRNDLLINVPPFVFVVLCCLPGGVTRNLRIKLSALAVAAAVFVVIGWPVLRAYESGSNTGHVALLGLMTPFDAPLGIRGSVYDWGYAYLDNYVGSTIDTYNRHVQGVSAPYLSKDYDRAAVSYLFQIARHWPADMLVRAYASARQVLEMPFTAGKHVDAIPRGLTGSWAALYERQIALVRFLSGAGVLAVAAALVIAGSASVWAGAVLLAFILYYAGYPALQFQVRHFFHLEFVAWLALGFVIERVILAARTLLRDWRAGTVKASAWRAPAIRAAAFAAGLLLVVNGSLAVLRAYQEPHVRALVAGYEAAPRERVHTSADIRGDVARIAIAETSTPGMHYLIASFSGGCGVARLPVTFRYTADERNDFTRASAVTLAASGSTDVFVPVYEGASRFEGIEIPRAHQSCLTSVAEMKDARAFPILLDLTLAPGWRQSVLHQTLEDETTPPSADADYYSVPAQVTATRSALEHPGGFSSADVVTRAPFAMGEEGNAWIVRGQPAATTSYLLRFKDRPAHRGDLFVATGTARDGAFLIGLLQGERWYRNVAVRTRGRFVVTIEAPDEGAYGVLLTANLQPNWIAAHTGVRLGRLLEWMPGATPWTDIRIDSIGWAAHEEALR